MSNKHKKWVKANFLGLKAKKFSKNMGELLERHRRQPGDRTAKVWYNWNIELKNCNNLLNRIEIEIHPECHMKILKYSWKNMFLKFQVVSLKHFLITKKEFTLQIIQTFETLWQILGIKMNKVWFWYYSRQRHLNEKTSPNLETYTRLISELSLKLWISWKSVKDWGTFQTEKE